MSYYQAGQNIAELVSYTYSFGSVFVGNFGPIVRKFGLKYSGAPLGRSTGVWLVGQLLVELYIDEKGYEKVKNQEIVFDPLFDSLGLDQLRELALYTGLDPKVAWDEEKLRTEIFGLLGRRLLQQNTKSVGKTTVI